MIFARLSWAVSLTAALATAQECTLQFDGRIPNELAAADFDVANVIFSNAFVLGQGGCWTSLGSRERGLTRIRPRLQPGIAHPARRRRVSGMPSPNSIPHCSRLTYPPVRHRPRDGTRRDPHQRRLHLQRANRLPPRRADPHQQRRRRRQHPGRQDAAL